MLELFVDIKDELQAVENELREVLKADYPILTETSTHLLRCGKSNAAGRHPGTDSHGFTGSR
jgi:hypothetical protein